MRVAKAGDAVSAAESTKVRLARKESTLKPLWYSDFREEVTRSLSLYLATRQQIMYPDVQIQRLWKRAPEPEYGLRRSPILFECTTQVVDSIVRTAWIDDFEHHIVTTLELADDAVELVLGPGRVFVDPGNNQTRLKTLQIGK